jgi:cell wall assembly regulator SMI1
MSISDMFRRIATLNEKEVGRGATDGEIASAESSLGVRFPESYKAFLATFGWARIHHDALYGVGPDVPSEYGLVTNVLSERNEAQPLIPHPLVAIMNDGAGNNYCLDTAKLRDGECPVVFWDHEHEDGQGQLPERVAPSFDKWLIDLIADRPPPNGA